MIASKNTQLLSSSAYLQTLMDNVINAQKSKDYNAVVKYSLAIVATSPNNSQARLLLAMYNGWDQKLCAIDENLAVSAVRRFFQKYASNHPYKEAQEIYEARREQVFCTLDSEASMPSFSNTKELHRTMLLWLRLLEEIPYLSPELIKGEIERAERICEKSKRSFDPRLRTIYAAYSSFNDKLPYGVTFSAALSPVIERAALRDQGQCRPHCCLGGVVQRFDCGCSRLRKQAGTHLSRHRSIERRSILCRVRFWTSLLQKRAGPTQRAFIIL